MTLQPPDFAATAQVVWVQEGEVATASPRAGNVTGPRVPPGEQFSVAIVGPEIKPVILSQQRVLAREPLAVQLESGSSAVIVCRDPWNGAVVPGCTVDLGTPSRALRTVANSKLAPHGQVTECGELRVLDLAKGSTQLLARAPGFAPTLRDVERLPSVADLPLEPAHELDIVLEDAANGRLIVGSVRVLQEVDDTALLVAAGGVEPGVQQPLLLAAGDYSIFAEAPGYRPTNVDVAVNKPHTRITVRLQKAVTVRGRVTDPSGTALPGAVVLAMTQHATFESMQNAATTDGGGQFQLTLPGEPPWSLFAKLAGYSSRPVTLTTASENVTLILERQCTVLILPLDAHSTPVRTETIVFMRPQTMEMVAANERTEDGWFRVQLAPGAWIAVIEDLGLQGRLTVPETCADWRGTLDLFAPNTQNAAPQH